MGAQVKAWMRETTYLTLALGFAMFCWWQALLLTSGNIAELAYQLGVEERDSLHVDREIEAFLRRAAVVPMPDGGGIAWVLVSCEEKP